MGNAGNDGNLGIRMGMRRIRVGMQGIRVRMWGIRVAVQRMGMGKTKVIVREYFCNGLFTKTVH